MNFDFAAWKHRIARAVSLAGHPFLVAPIALFLLLCLDQGEILIAWKWTSLCVVIVLLPALLYLRRKLRRKEYTDADVSVREHRFGFYLFGAGCMLLCALALFLFRAPRVLLHGTATSLMALFLAILLNRFWTKISIHAGTLVAIATALSRYDAVLSSAFAVLALLVCWSRLTLQRHTPIQLLAGALVGFTSVTLLFRP